MGCQYHKQQLNLLQDSASPFNKDVYKIFTITPLAFVSKYLFSLLARYNFLIAKAIYLEHTRFKSDAQLWTVVCLFITFCFYLSDILLFPICVCPLSATTATNTVQVLIISFLDYWSGLLTNLVFILTLLDSVFYTELEPLKV